MKGLLLLNLGTPEAPTAGAVRRYLGQFLNDPRVIDINPVGRRALVHGIILRTRPKKSARAYQKIWDEERGSPLLYHTLDLARGVSDELGSGWVVEVGMRYGEPTISSALDALIEAGADPIVALSLYPQYASSTTGSSIEALYRAARKKNVIPAIATITEFFDAPGFIKATAEVARRPLQDQAPERILFSFHGLPERHIRKAQAAGGSCLTGDYDHSGIQACCATLNATNRHCYRAQCYATARALAAELELPGERWAVAFQSRMGKDPWIQPHTDATVAAWAAEGVKSVAILCPAFTADCLETLEEIGMGIRDEFLAAGGELFAAIPCVNSHPEWVKTVAEMARGAAG